MAHKVVYITYEIATFVLSQLLNVRRTKNSPTTSMHATTRAGPCLGLILAVGWMMPPLRVVDAPKEPT